LLINNTSVYPSQGIAIDPKASSQEGLLVQREFMAGDQSTFLILLSDCPAAVTPIVGAADTFLLWLVQNTIGLNFALIMFSKMGYINPVSINFGCIVVTCRLLFHFIILFALLWFRLAASNLPACKFMRNASTRR